MLGRGKVMPEPFVQMRLRLMPAFPEFIQHTVTMLNQDLLVLCSMDEQDGTWDPVRIVQRGAEQILFRNLGRRAPDNALHHSAQINPFFIGLSQIRHAAP